MKRFLVLLIFLVTLAGSPQELWAQRKKKNNQDRFVPPTATTKRQAPSVSPVRKILNLFNLSLELGKGGFNHKQELSDVVLVRTNIPENWIYIFPSADASSGGPYNGLTNWFNRNRPVVFDQIYDDDLAINTDTLPVSFKNQGTYNPVTLRLSFSIKKTDKLHLKTTGERRSLDQDLVRIGGGISFGKMKYKQNFFTAIDQPNFGELLVPVIESKQTKMFGSISVSALNYLDFTMFVDVEAGVWKFKSESFDTEVITYDPFFSLGLTFEKKLSKYFKVYLKPALEFRNYQFEVDPITVPNKITTFSMNLGFLIKYPTYPRNRFKAHQVQMEHVFNGKIYRGRSIFRRQNPKIGQNFKKRKNR